MSSTVPPFVPILAYPDSDYPAGADPWAETPRVVEPSGGALEDGLVPGDQIPAQYYNFMLQRLGRFADAVADAHVFSPRAEPVFADGHCNMSNGRGTAQPLVQCAGRGHWIVPTVPDGGELLFKSHALMGLDPAMAGVTSTTVVLAGDISFDPAEWVEDPASRTVTCLVDTAAKVHFDLTSIPNGATITGITAYVTGGAGHSALPYMPQVVLIGYSTLGALFSFDSQVDTSATKEAYEIAHTINLTGGTTVIDYSQYRYGVDIINEYGTNAEIGLIATSISVTYTLPAEGPRYVLSASAGLTDPTDPGVLAARADGACIIAIATTMDPGSCTYTTDLGATWSNGGALTLAANDAPQCGAFYDTKWWVFSSDDSATDLLISSSTATPATWTNASLAILPGYSDFVPRRVIRTPDAMVVVPDTNYGIAVYTPNGSGTGTWTAVAVSTASATALYWRGAYNAQIGQTLLCNAAGELWMADSECTGWGYIDTITGYELVDAVATGRGWLVSAHKATAPRETIFFVYQDYDKAWKWRAVWTSMAEADTYYGTSVGSFHFVRVEGRVIALRTPSTGTAEIEAHVFGTFPADAEYDRALSGW